METFFQVYQIERNDIGNAGSVASFTKRELKRRNLSRGFVKTVTIGVYEAEINVVIHSYGGNVSLEINDQFVELIFRDKGPGIINIDDAMREGFSTASPYAIENGFGAGMGLPNIKAVSDEMEMTSSPEGTYLRIRFNIGEDSYES